MSFFIKKVAAAEDSGLVDPRTNRPIRVTTTVRCKYRRYYGGTPCKSDEANASRSFLVRDEEYATISNKDLNEMIAQDFAASANDAIHMFLSRSSDISSKQREWIEIRKAPSSRPFNVFFSVIRSDVIDIIAINTNYKKPQKGRLWVPK